MAQVWGNIYEHLEFYFCKGIKKPSFSCKGGFTYFLISPFLLRSHFPSSLPRWARSISTGLVIQNYSSGLLLSFSLAVIYRWTQKSWLKLNPPKNEITLQVKDFASLRLRHTMIDKMQQKIQLLITLNYWNPWKGLTLCSKQSVSRNNGLVNP